MKGESVLSSAYFSCVGGASGDMVLGALLDAGLAADKLEEALGCLNVQRYTLSSRRDQRGGVTGTLVSVDVTEDARRPRGWEEFDEIIQQSSLSSKVADRALAVFRRLAEAEAMAHGVEVGETRLHELGSLDTLIDIVGSVAGLEMLGVEQVYSSPLPSGSGVIRSDHGLLPVPSPATAALISMARAPIVPPPGNAPDAGEMVTPTGAAILTTLATFRQPAMDLVRVGYGLGSRDSPHYPNALALWLGEETDVTQTADTTLIETNVDDMSGEHLGYVQERLFELGARDVWFTPIQMKKNRPGTMLSAIVQRDLEPRAVQLILRETSTLGVRVRPLSRYEAERRSVEVETSLGRVGVKLKRLAGKTIGVSPDYEACRRVALERGMPLQQVYRIVHREAEEQLLES